jgi:DnaJ-class molecular chaperone
MAGFQENPYEVLGVPPGASMETVKRRYKQLAMQHHPDRWAGKGCSVEEMAVHKEAFQRITVAYHSLMENGGHSDPATQPDLDSIWNMFQRHSVLEKLSVFLKRTFEMRREAGKAREARKTRAAGDARAASNTESKTETETKVPEEEMQKSYHSFTIMVSLEEIAQKKRKKVRLLLKTGDEKETEPVIITVMCHKYPSYETMLVRNRCFRHLMLSLVPAPHAHYTIDVYGENGEPPEEGLDERQGFHLYRGLPMTLLDYFTGKSVEWLHPSGESIVLEVPPFLGMKREEQVDAMKELGGSSSAMFWKKEVGRGLLGKGDLIVYLQWQFPSQIAWDTLNPVEKEQWITILEKLTRLDAFHET